MISLHTFVVSAQDPLFAAVLRSLRTFSRFHKTQSAARRRAGSTTLVAVLTVMCLLFSASAALAATTWTVTGTGDTATPSAGNCVSSRCPTLRDAISAAVDGDTIIFTSGLSGSITLSGGTMNITQGITINGTGASISVSGSNAYQVFNINSIYPVTISWLTIQDGKSTNGGGIEMFGSQVIVSNCTLKNNSADEYGGGINNDFGVLTVTNSTFSHNSAPAMGMGGGGIYNRQGTATVSNSTFSNNSASTGGGINNSGGGLTVTNSTFSDNSVAYGGGIASYYDYTSMPVTVNNSTFSNNSASIYGGAIWNSNNPLTITNSIFSNNSINTSYGSGAGIYDGTGTVNASYNVYYNNLTQGIEDDCLSCGSNAPFTNANSDVVAALGNYGGFTQTRPPIGQAIGAGQYQPGEPTTDQRGASRPASGVIDAGAVQVTGNPPMIAVTPNNGPMLGGTQVTITGVGLEGVTAVKFGNIATSFVAALAPGTTLVSITATSPAAASAGTVDVTVSTAGVTSVINPADQFTYIGPAATVADSSLVLTVNQPTSNLQPVVGSGGIGTLSYSISPTPLPAGLSFDSTSGSISGTPSMYSPATLYTVTVTDSATQSVTGQFSLEVDKIGQTITGFAATPANPTYSPSGVFTLAASGGGSGNAVTYASTTTGICTVSGSTVTILSAGICKLNANQLGNAIYSDSPEVLLDVTINKATPTINWTNPADITHGTALGASQLNATVAGGLAGAFVYTPASGTVLNVGAGQVLSVTFTPSDTTDYNSATATVSINVTPAPNYSVTASPTALSIKQGQSGTATISLTGTNGYANSVSFTCGTLPAGMSCIFAPSTVTAKADGSAVNSVLTITTTRSTAMLRQSGARPVFAMYWMGFGALGIVYAGCRRKRFMIALSLFVCVALLLSLSACGNNGGKNNAIVTPIGTSTVVITAVASANGTQPTTPTQTLSLAVTVTQ